MNKQKKKISIGWVIFWLIVFFPVGLYLMWVRTTWNKKIKVGISIFFLILILYGLFATGKETAESSSEELNTTAANVIESSESEESESIPDPNTSAMVDYIARQAKKSANISATEEKRNEAIDFIVANYPDYFSNNELIEKTMYYGYYLEYAYAKNGSENLYANLGIDVYQAVKGVYRSVDKIEDDIVQENLRQIQEALSELGYEV